MNRSALIFLAAAALSLGSGFLLFRRTAAQAEETSPGRCELTQTDAMGNSVVLPVEFDGSCYTLEDSVRKIYVHDGTNARSSLEPIYDPGRFPLYTSETGVFEDSLAVSAYSAVIKSYDFYTEENVGRLWQGIRGPEEEISMHIVLHMNRTEMAQNAAFTYSTWSDDGFILIGDGDQNGGYLYRQAQATDVLAHEYQHGVSTFLHYPGLGTTGEAGAINEAISDIFGMLIEGHDPSEEEFWQIGENATALDVPLRSVKDPEGVYVGDEPNLSNAKDKLTCRHFGAHTDECDNGHVHQNSTIISHVQYTAWELAPDFFTRENIGKLWFKLLDLFINGQNASFTLFSSKLIEAAQSLEFDRQAVEALEYSLYLNGFTDRAMHKVEFTDEEGNLLARSFVYDGEAATLPVPPVRSSTPTVRYEFDGWGTDLSEIHEDLTVSAQFHPVERKITRYLDADGTLLAIRYLEEGETPPEDPRRESTAQYDFAFVGWMETLGENGETVQTAEYENILRNYEITLHSGETSSVTLPYGAELPRPPKGYEGWYLDPECTQAALNSVKGTADLYAKKKNLSLPIALAIGAGAIFLIGGIVFAVLKRNRS